MEPNSMIQFNIYKFNDLTQKLMTITGGMNENTIHTAQAIIEEWCWTYSRKALIDRWQQQYNQPPSASSNLTLLHYNIRHFYTNQCDLVDMIERVKPSVISLNELGTEIPVKKIAKILFSYDIFKSEGTNAHGGVVLA